MKKIEEIRSQDGKLIRKRVFTVNEDPSLTDQSQAKEADINEIIRKFERTGQITHLAKNRGIYADLSMLTDLQTAMEEVKFAEEAFMTIPADIRAKFDNDPTKLISFLANPANDDEAIKLGFKEPKKQVDQGEPIATQSQQSSQT